MIFMKKRLLLYIMPMMQHEELGYSLDLLIELFKGITAVCIKIDKNVYKYDISLKIMDDYLCRSLMLNNILNSYNKYKDYEEGESSVESRFYNKLQNYYKNNKKSTGGRNEKSDWTFNEVLEVIRVIVVS